MKSLNESIRTAINEARVELFTITYGTAKE